MRAWFDGLSNHPVGPTRDCLLIKDTSLASTITTLLRSLNFPEMPDAGTVTVCGIEVECTGAPQNHRASIRRKSARSVNAKGASRVEAAERGMRLLNQVGLAEKADQYPARLSGGQKQRVAIARALAMEPEVILFDEPTSALDPALREDVLTVMRDLAKQGMTMLVVTHEVRFARDVADRVVFMDGGVVAVDTTSQAFFGGPGHPRVRQFLNLIDA